MDKLTFEAVPTENGPFCEPVKELKPEFSHEVPIVYSITLDDIENDQLSFNEKKATFSVKYADFLTNSDIDTINASFDCALKNVDSSLDNMHTLKDFCDNSQKTTCGQTNRISLPAEVNKKFQSQPMLVVQPFSDSDNKILNSDWVDDPEKVDIKSNSGISTPKTMSRSNNRIKIISEKKISKPFPIKGKLEPVSPSVVLRVRNKKTNNETNNIENMETQKSIEPQVVKNASNTENNSLLKMHPRNKKSLLKSSNNSNSIKSSCDISPMKGIINREQSSPSVSMLRNKIPPERVAAIEEKRSFNKKLRDMIEFCLDDQDKNINEIVLEKALVGNQNYVQNVVQDVQPKRTMRPRKSKEKPESNKNLEKPLEPEHGTTHARQSSLEGVNEFNIMSSLEARLKMMEDTLLSRIDQNSKQIVDLKKDLPHVSRKQSTPTQTAKFDNEEVYKKHLFNEISKYLSPSTNSSIYEELFINKYGQNTSQSTEQSSHSQPKRRRRML